MSDLLAKVLGTMIAISVLVSVIQVPALLIFFGLIFGVMYFMNIKL